MKDEIGREGDEGVLIGHLIRQKRQSEKITLEQAARIAGVSAATLSRWERKADVPRAESSGSGLPQDLDARTYRKLAKWLELKDQGRFQGKKNFPNVSAAETGQGGRSTPDVLEAHLRADPRLGAEAADLISKMIRMTYENMADKSEEPKNQGEGKPE